MPYKTGLWGEQAKIRSKKRKIYFRKKNDNRKEHNKEKRKEVINKLGGKCKTCGFSDIRALHIDHIKGGGSIERKNMDQTAYLIKVLNDKSGNYQLLCANCNWIKRYTNNELLQRREV